ncbi:WD40 repeat-like protein [Suillus brevipes Sb2]|nr:WD40 repeat-like protein [Suillus brevipes Sb2]
MLNEEAESSKSPRRGEALLHSPTHVAHRTSEKEPPPYGTQHRQDALWEGGNEALPPLWQQFEASDAIYYQDDTLTMVSFDRPLPGVRLDYPGHLVDPEFEWHISPLGRSYFVNHSTRTTSWKKPKPERPAGSLTPECIIEGHSRCIWSLAYLKASCNIMSASGDGSIRQWKRDGEPVGKSWDDGGGAVQSIALNLDDTTVVCGSADGRLWLWNIQEGSMIGDPWGGHDAAVKCLDWSPNALEIASGSEDGTIRRWNPDTGRQIAPPIKTRHGWVYVVKYSPEGDKFISGGDGAICVWSRDGKLLKEINGHDSGPITPSENGRRLMGRSSLFFGVILMVVRSFCLTPNERYIVSASYDYSVRIWDLKTNQAVGDPLLHDDQLLTVVMSPDGKYIASAGIDQKIYVWNLEVALERYQGRPTQPRVIIDVRLHFERPNTGGSAKYGKDFFADHPNRRAAPPANPSLLNWRSLFGSFRFSGRPADAPRPSPRVSRHWNFSLLPVGNSRHTVEVAPARDEDRYGITPETDAEAAAAMQRTDGNEADNSTQPGQPAAGSQASQVQPIQTPAQVSTGGAEGVVYEGVSCCGFFFGRRRPASHRS